MLPAMVSVGADCTVSRGVDEVAARMEVVVDEHVNGEEVLCLSRGFEPLHLPFSPSRRD